eukprot:4087046-Pyramimonas_sp.AAC.1
MTWDCRDDSGSLENPRHELREYLIHLKATGILTAKQACLIAHVSSRAGANGIADLGYSPGRQTGKYSDHWDR